jgi:methionine biosynthesis protein MetW
MNDANNSSLRADLHAIAELIRPGEKVLDLGCGDGTLLRHLTDMHQITGRGIEISEPGVLACVRKGLSVRQGNLEEGLSDYPNGSFDSVILSQTLPYLNNPGFIICEMLRVGRRAIVSFANWGHWRCRLSLLLTGCMPMAPGSPQPWHASPRARPLTVHDFKVFCAQQNMRITNEVYLAGEGRKLSAARGNHNLRATTAIFELS